MVTFTSRKILAGLIGAAALALASAPVQAENGRNAAAAAGAVGGFALGAAAGAAAGSPVYPGGHYRPAYQSGYYDDDCRIVVRRFQDDWGRIRVRRVEVCD
jgi:hypothetical protein